jgi:ribosomal protein S18 acetylase RimI-like enzyme
MGTTIREARASDLAALATLFDLYRQFYEQAPDLERATAFLAQRVERQESVILVACDAKGNMRGFCQLYPSFCSVEARPIYTLYDLFVHPAARQGGVGRQLLAAARERAQADGKSRMDLTTAKTNHAAQALYESMGWQRDEVFFAYQLPITPAAASPQRG